MVCAAAAGAGDGQHPQQQQQQQQQHQPHSKQPTPLDEPFLLTLERAVGGRAGADAALAASGLFGAEVFPDLPVATSWDGLVKAMARHVRQVARHAPAHEARAAAESSGSGAASSSSSGSGSGSGSGGGGGSLWRVETVGAQLRDAADLERRILAACGGGGGSGGGGSSGGGGTSSSSGHPAALRPADALLFVSGSHPARQLPGAQRFLPGSVSLLRAAARLRAGGAIPAATSLWAVANPVTERDASRLEAKVAAGAEAVLTQPPLDWPAFEAWWADVARRGLERRAKIMVGFPALSGATNASFWLALAGGGGSAAARRVVADFAAAEARGKEAAAEFARRYSEEQLARVSLSAVCVLCVRAEKWQARQEVEGRGRYTNSLLARTKHTPPPPIPRPPPLFFRPSTAARRPRHRRPPRDAADAGRAPPDA